MDRALLGRLGVLALRRQGVDPTDRITDLIERRPTTAQGKTLALWIEARLPSLMLQFDRALVTSAERAQAVPARVFAVSRTCTEIQAEVERLSAGLSDDEREAGVVHGCLRGAAVAAAMGINLIGAQVWQGSVESSPAFVWAAALLGRDL